MSLEGRKIVVGMTGGIACYKIPNLVRLLVKQKAEVRVIMTEAATKFIKPLTLETVSGNPVEWQMFPENQFVATRHIDLAEWPGLFVIAPATAKPSGPTPGYVPKPGLVAGRIAPASIDDVLGETFKTSPLGNISVIN